MTILLKEDNIYSEVKIVDILEMIFWQLWEESDPKTPDFQANKKLQHSLLEKAEEALGPKWVDKWDDIYWEYMELQSKRFFLNGLRFGLNLLALVQEQED